MLLEYVWCDKINVNGKNSSESAPVRKYVNIYMYIIITIIVNKQTIIIFLTVYR